MKTTVEITAALLDEARRTAAKEKTTLRDLIEEGLRRTLDERKEKQPFRLRQVSFKGEGLQPGVSLGSWQGIRELIYEGRGA